MAPNPRFDWLTGFDQIDVPGVRGNPKLLRLRRGREKRPPHRDRNDPVVRTVQHQQRRPHTADPA